MTNNINKLEKIATLLRYYSLISTTAAGSGHPTSSLSAADLMAVLFFGGFFRADLEHPEYINNDRLIFSKGHASPLLYSLYTVAGKVTEEELLTLRKFGSRLEGHPTLAFPYTEAATGSLGQGLSVGVGMAMNAKYLDHMSYTTYVLLGDSEMAEGSAWEAIMLAAQYKLGNLVAILDVNRLGQRGETMLGHDIATYEKRIASFGWHTITIDGHSIEEITQAFTDASIVKDRPVMIIAKTLKGKGVSFIEDKDNWHGKALSQEDLQKAIQELGDIDTSFRGKLRAPKKITIKQKTVGTVKKVSYAPDTPVATRKAYGNALVRIADGYPNMVVLDAETSNSTFAEFFKQAYPKRFFEMYIAEQNMVGVALGMSRRGKIPFVSTFAAFFSRAFDQIRMAGYSGGNIKFVGSHVGVSIGEDGISQMGLEDISMFRAIQGSVVLYPSDAYSAELLTEQAAKHEGIVYLRMTRKDTPILFTQKEIFRIGGSKVLRKSKQDVATVVACGITLHEALAAYEILKKDNIFIRVIDLYSIKPLDVATLKKAARETGIIITVEDHYAEGGVGEAVIAALALESVHVHTLAVRKQPKSGTPDELLSYAEISRNAIVKKVKKLVKQNSNEQQIRVK
ncbi:MAG TPA: transketolase [Candidatus Andersenbacteria bacterium]|nr:transketolase [Candidatus Andersenbacteria bacterium]